MKYQAGNKKMSMALSCALAMGFASSAIGAEINPADTGYLTDQRGVVVRSGYGLCWHTGTGPAMPSPNECDAKTEPVKVAQAPAEQKPAVAVPPKPAGGKVTLDASTLFDFNKAVLRPAGREALDEFLDKVKGIEPEVIIAIGHADRFGSDQYNQRLSEQRADAVKAYLVGKGIEPNRVYREGKGESQPITKAGECQGAKSAKVIACLQPDRRVEVEVVGTEKKK